MATTLHPPLTVEEYLELDRVSETRLEFLNGEVFDMVGANRRHLQIVSNLHGNLFHQLKGRGWRAWMNDLRVSPTVNNYVYPDVVIFERTAPLVPVTGVDTLKEPRVIFEVLSSSTEHRDRGIKRELYCGIASLQHYVLVASESPRIEHWEKNATGTWNCQILTELTATLDFSSVQAKLSVAEIYESVDW